MDINRYLYHFGLSISVIFGGMFSLNYMSEGQVQLEQLYTCIIGIMLVIGAFFWRKLILKKKM